MACTAERGEPVAVHSSSRPTRRDGQGQRAAQRLIRHIVVLYLENHTFDNLLGYWCDQPPRPLPRRGDAGVGQAVRRHGGHAWRHAGHRAHLLIIQFRARRLAIDGGKMDGWQNIR